MDIPAPVKIFWPLLFLTLLLVAVPNIASAQTPEPIQSLPYDEAEAYAIDGLIMCPVCPAETIDQAQVPIARQMRQIVRDMLAQGATREEILDFFVQRYGQEILAAPPKSGFNLVAWIFPLVGVAVALAAGVLVLRSMKSNRSPIPQTMAGPQAAEDLQPYLDIVDRQMALRESASDTSDSGDDNVRLQREGNLE